MTTETRTQIHDGSMMAWMGWTRWMNAGRALNVNKKMALVVPLCSASSIGRLQFRTNGFNCYESRTHIRNRNWCSSVPIKKTSTPKRHRSPIIIPSASDTDPLQNNPHNDEEVDSLGVKAALSILKFYKREISPLLPKSCRYVPTCSEYSMIAYKKYGFVKGTILTGWRICRCNPLGGSGFDPPRWFDERSPIEE